MSGFSYNTFEEETLDDLARRRHQENAPGPSSRPSDATPPPQVQSVSRGKKAVAACTGAFTTSLLSEYDSGTAAHSC